MSAYRLASGGLVNRSQPLNFTFDGKAMKESLFKSFICMFLEKPMTKLLF